MGKNDKLFDLSKVHLLRWIQSKVWKVLELDYRNSHWVVPLNLLMTLYFKYWAKAVIILFEGQSWTFFSLNKQQNKYFRTPRVFMLFQKYIMQNSAASTLASACTYEKSQLLYVPPPIRGWRHGEFCLQQVTRFQGGGCTCLFISPPWTELGGHDENRSLHFPYLGKMNAQVSL